MRVKISNFVDVCLDETCFTQKPESAEIVRIMASMADKKQTIEIEQLAKQLVQPFGRTVCPAVFSTGSANNESWKAQQLFFIDIDKGLPLDEALRRCEEFDIKPVFAYSTFSHIANNKYRLVFNHWESISDKQIHTLIIKSLLTLFPEADQSCSDLSRKFFGGKELIYSGYTNTFDLVKLIEQTCHFLKVQRRNNSTKYIKQYCEKIGLATDNCHPAIYAIDHAENEMKRNISGYAPIIYNRRNQQILYSLFLTLGNAPSKDKVTSAKVLSHPSSEIKSQKQLDFGKVRKSCMLFEQFEKGTVWLYYNELFGLATNLLNIKGGRAKFISGLKANPKYSSQEGGNKLNYFENYGINYIAKKNYKPKKCVNYCPFADKCFGHSSNIITSTQLQKGEVKLFAPVENISIASAEVKLKEYIEFSLNTTEEGTYLIKAETGLGKTELYVNSNSLGSIVIAVPRHDLKNQVADRFRLAGKEVFIYPDPPKLTGLDKNITNQLYSLGGYESANSYLYKICISAPTVKNYLDQLKLIKRRKNAIIITTHDRVIHNPEYFCQNTVIFDEDIMNSLIKKDSTTLKDLEDLKDSLISFAHDEIHLYLSQLIEKLQMLPKGVFQTLPFPPPFQFKKYRSHLPWELRRHKSQQSFFKKEFHKTTNVFDFFNCDKFYIDDKDNIRYFKVKKLNFKKVIVLSATPNVTYYEKLFGDKLHYFNIEPASPVGEIQQNLTNSFSRTKIKYDPTLVEALSSFVDDDSVITYKKYKDMFKNPVGHFGGLTGLNHLKGENLTIIGTPHVNESVYFLDAAALGFQCEPAKETMANMIVEHNGLKFYFFTYANLDLQNIQLAQIGSGILQAVGRARHLREKCTVKVFSNLPLQGAEYIQFDLTSLINTKEDAS